MANTNGLIECQSVCATGSVASNYYLRKGDPVPPNSYTQYLFGQESAASFIPQQSTIGFSVPVTGNYVVEASVVFQNATSVPTTQIIGYTVNSGTDNEYGDTLPNANTVPKPALTGGVTNNYSYSLNSVHTLNAGTNYNLNWYALDSNGVYPSTFFAVGAAISVSGM